MSSIKSYKLSKTFENSVYPLEQELKSINDNTISSTLNNVAGAVFGGVGTSILFQDNCLPQLLNFIYNFLKIPNEIGIRSAINVGIAFIIFIILYIVGRIIDKYSRRKPKLLKKKKSVEGRSELKEIFHKSIINDIVTGLSFVDKAEEIEFIGDVAKLYLYEAVYYFQQAEIQMEEMELLYSEKNKNHEKFVNEIGKNTIRSTCKVFDGGLRKLENQLDDNEPEKEIVSSIIRVIQCHLKNRSVS